MLQIILLVGGMAAALYGVNLRHRTADDCPNVDPHAFAQWLRAVCVSMCALVFACWGTLVVQMAITFMRLSAADYSSPMGNVGGIISMFTLLGGLIVGGLMNVKATRLRWQAGIRV
jgi:hypothetical protein